MVKPAPLRRTLAVDAFVLVILFACEVVLQGVGFSTPPVEVDFALPPEQWVFLVVLYLPLLFRQRAPVLVLVAVLALRALGFLALGLPAGWLGELAGLWTVAALHPKRVSVALLAIAAGSELGILEVLALDGPALLPRLRAALTIAAVAASAWGLGFWTRQRRRGHEQRERELARERRARSQLVVVEERARMARELHDILAHSISVMIVQAAGARLVLASDRERVREALAQIERTGRQSMIEVRRLLGLLRTDAGTAPVEAGLAGVDTLVQQVTAVGVPVRLVVHGEPRDLPASVDLAAYRVVQEALTNVVKHAWGATATVTLTHDPDELGIEVADDGGGSGVSAAPGKGLTGMQERIRLVGGRVEAGVVPGVGFRVAAVLPIGSRELAGDVRSAP